MSNNIKKLTDIIISNSSLSQLFEQNNALDVYNSWSYIVGEQIASHSRLIDIKNNIAIIETDHNGWAQQILLKKREILKKFKKKYVELAIKNLSVIISSSYEKAESVYINNANNKTFKVDEEVPANSTNTDFSPELIQAFKKLKNSIIEQNLNK